MDDGNPLLCVAILILFILIDAVFYGFGAAIQNMNANDLERQMEEGDDKARKLLHIVNRPTRFVNAIQVSTNGIGILTGAVIFYHMGTGFTHYLSRRGALAYPGLSLVGLLIAGVLAVVLLVSFGIVIPKRCSAHNPEKWGKALLPLISILMVILIPLTCLINGLSFLFLKLVGLDMNSDSDNVTEEDIMSMVNEGHEQGVLEAREAQMITNIFQLDDKDAGDIMTHRKNLVALDGSMTLSEAVTFILKEGYNSRYPIYGEDVDDIRGILHMKDALIAAEGHENMEVAIQDIAGLLREAHFIPETRNIDSLFKEMQSQKTHMVIVVDEYGQTAGIVTMEDILEEIVGNIMDEYDVDEEFIAQSEDGSYIISGMTPLCDVARTLAIEFEEEDNEAYDTINGFLISKLNRIPQEGERTLVEYQGYGFQIIQVENKTIHTVCVRRLVSPSKLETGGDGAGEENGDDGKGKTEAGREELEGETSDFSCHLTSVVVK